jgi:DNA topoisomerase VI subunit B
MKDNDCKTFQNGNKKNNLKLKTEKNDTLIVEEMKNRKVERWLGRRVTNRYGKWKEKKEKVI